MAAAVSAQNHPSLLFLAQKGNGGVEDGGGLMAYQQNWWKMGWGQQSRDPGTQTMYKG